MSLIFFLTMFVAFVAFFCVFDFIITIFFNETKVPKMLPLFFLTMFIALIAILQLTK